MCFVLYIGTDFLLPSIPWDEKDRHLNTEELGEYNAMVAKHFTKPFVNYVGSDLGCGCGFRSVTFQDGEWPEELYIGCDPDYDGSVEEKNHRELFDFLTPLVAEGGSIEIYGCWDGDFEESIKHKETISLNRLLDRKFFFRERGLYIISKERTSCWR